MAGTFVVSLDFELMWGSRDHATKADYGRHVLGERQAVPAMLDLFHRWGIHATWATVGFLLCDGRDELLARAPDERPTYTDARLSNYAYVAETGGSEREDPYYFAPSMVRDILNCPHQELSTHTFSHYYCLEGGQTDAQFTADLRTAIAQLRDWNVDCRSIVFPRNQYASRHLGICESEGLSAFRGTESKWMYRPGNGAAQSLVRRAARLADTYLSLSGSNAAPPGSQGTLLDVPSSRFLRPISHRLRFMDDLRLSRITSAMKAAAVSGGVFHLWWHPHNFGVDTADNIEFLTHVIMAHRRLADEYGMTSSTIAEVADTIRKATRQTRDAQMPSGAAASVAH